MVLPLKRWKSRTLPSFAAGALRKPIHNFYLWPFGHNQPDSIVGAGWSSPVARQAHNLKVVGSNPTPATNHIMRYFQKSSLSGAFLRSGLATDIVGAVGCAVPPATAMCSHDFQMSQLFDNHRIMELVDAAHAMGALAQVTRLEVFRLLVRHEPDGLAAGDIARKLAVPANTLSTHLAVLTRAGLTTSVRHSRSIIYRADIDGLRNLMVFLAKDCCGAREELCGPLAQELVSC